MLAITRFINYLYAGKNKGRGRASRQLLEKMGFPRSSPKKERIKRMLVKAGIIEIGSYASRELSREYGLTSMAVGMLDEDRKQ